MSSSLHPELFNAILSMDAYNRSYDENIILNGSPVGDANIITDSSVLLDENNQRSDDDIGFYAFAYSYKGETIISYRGTDYPEGEDRTIRLEYNSL